MGRTTIWSNVVFCRVLVAQFVSGLGDKLIFFIVPLWILQTTNSPFQVSVISASTTIIIIVLSPFMGTFVDRLSKRNLMIITDILRFLFVILLGFFTFLAEFNFGFILLIYALYTASSSLYSPASDVALTLIVEEKHIRDAVSLRQVSNQIENLIGPMLGGILLAFISNPSLIFIGDSICFLVGAGILLLTKYPTVNIKRKKVSYWEDFKEGIAIVFKENRLRVLIISAAIINILGAAIMLSLQVHVVQMETNSLWWSIIFTSSPIGILLGSVLSRKLKLNNRAYTDAFLFCSVMGLFNIFMGFSLAPIPLTITYFLSGVAFGLSNVYFGVLYRKLISKDKQGRFFGFLNASLLLAIPLGQLITGFILEYISPTKLLILFGAITVITALTSLQVLKKENMNVPYDKAY